MDIVNLTDTPITIVNDNGLRVKTFPSEGKAWVDVKMVQDRIVDGVRICSKKFGKVHGIPQPNENLEKCYIVTEDVANAIRDHRFDILVANGLVNEENHYYKSLLQP